MAYIPIVSNIYSVCTPIKRRKTAIYIRKIKGFLKQLILLIHLKIIFKADKENKTWNLLKFFEL